MKSVLLSIQPKWCELIASGRKTVEIRKTKPKIETPFKCYIYCTKQNVPGEILLTYNKKVEGRNKGFRDNGDIPLAGKVIGEFICDNIKWNGNSAYVIREECIKALEGSCLTEEEFHNYMDYPPVNPYQDPKEALKKYEFYGWHISDLVIYDKPKELTEFYTLDNKAVQKCENRIQTYYSFTDTGYIKNGMYCDYREDWCIKCKRKLLKRPPQSWCYVERYENN